MSGPRTGALAVSRGHGEALECFGFVNSIDRRTKALKKLPAPIAALLAQKQMSCAFCAASSSSSKR